MTITDVHEEVKRFRATAWPFQQTFLTPLKQLPEFVATILSASPVTQASVIIEQMVFEPKHLLALLAKHSLSIPNWHDAKVTAATEREAAELLEAALADWLDFLFLPATQTFAIYADHDEYNTFYAQTDSILNGFRLALRRGEFKAVEGYERRF